MKVLYIREQGCLPLCDIISLLSQAWGCALSLSSLSRKICASKQSFGNGEKGNQYVVTLVKFTLDAMKSCFCVAARNRL